MGTPIPFPAKRRRIRRTTKIPLEIRRGAVISLSRSSDLHAYIWIGIQPGPGEKYGSCFGTLGERGMRQLRKAIDDALALREQRIAGRARRAQARR